LTRTEALFGKYRVDDGEIIIGVLQICDAKGAKAGRRRCARRCSSGSPATDAGVVALVAGVRPPDVEGEVAAHVVYLSMTLPTMTPVSCWPDRGAGRDPGGDVVQQVFGGGGSAVAFAVRQR
jgi:hypothetical protein